MLRAIIELFYIKGEYYMKYKNELQIKKALGVENWRNLSKDKVIRFAALMPDMDKEVMLEIIKSFPEFTKYGNDLMESLKETILKSMDKNSEDYQMSLAIIKETQSICKEQLNRTDLSDEERILIWNNLMEVTKMIPAMDKDNKKFYEFLNNKYFKATAAALGTALVFIGGKVIMDQISEQDMEDANE